MNVTLSRGPRPRPSHKPRPRAADTMVRAFRVVPAWTPVADLLPGARPGAVYPVLDARGALMGTLDLAELTTLPELHGRLAGEVCRPVDAQSVLAPQDRVVPDRLPGLVLEHGRLIGILPADPARTSHPRRKAS